MSNTTSAFEHPLRTGWGVWAITDGANDWDAGVVVKSKKIRRHDLEPGWYRYQSIDKALRTVCPTCQHRSDGKTDEYFAITPAGQYEPVERTGYAHVVAITSGPLPGDPHDQQRG